MPKFKGCDYSEVVEYFKKSKRYHYNPKENYTGEWPIDLGKYGDSDDANFLAWLNITYQKASFKAKFQITTACRNYVCVLANESHKIDYSGALWDGLWNINNDETFMKYFTVLFQYLWN